MNKRKKTIIETVIIFIILILIFIFGSVIDEQQLSINYEVINNAPSFAYPFGTDWMGRNMLFLVFKGVAVSMSIGMIASILSVLLAFLIGTLSIFENNIIDNAVSWLIDLVMGIPNILLLVLVSIALGKGMRGLIISMALTHWMSLARLVRSEVLQLKNRQYIKISKSLGKSRGYIILHHILPQIMAQLIVGWTLTFPHVILHESAISFLGYGLPPEQPSIGVILAQSMNFLVSGCWWLALFPGALLVLVVMLFDRVGKNLEKILAA